MMNKVFEAIALFLAGIQVAVLVLIVMTLGDINDKLDRQYQVTVTSTSPLVNITKE